MRALFIPVAAAGHFFPMVPLAWALRTAGHDVRFAGQPPVTDLVARSGLTTIAVGESYDLMAGIADADRTIRQRLGSSPASYGVLESMPPELRKWNGEMRIAPHVRAAEAMADELVEFARLWRPDVVVTDPIAMVAPLVAEATGVPLVHHLWGPQEPSLTKFAGFGADVNRWPADLGKLFDRFGAGIRADYSRFTIAPCPPSLQAGPAPKRHTTRYVPYNGSGVLPGWLGSGSGRPRVCVSWTTSKAVTPTAEEHPVTAIVQALSGLDVDLVVAITAGDRGRLGPLPAETRVVEDLPLGVLLPTCAVSVNTGGAGSVLTAAVNGVPQVIVPQGPGHAFNAARIAAVGAGALFGGDQADLGELTASVRSMLSDDRWRDAARSVQEENRAQPPLADAVRRLERLS